MATATADSPTSATAINDQITRRSRTTSPRRPLGRKIRIKISIENARTSFVLGAERAAREQGQVGGRERLQEPEDEPADHGAGNVSDAAEHRRGEGLQAGDEAAVGVDQAVLNAEQHARGTAHGPTDQERERDDPIDIDAHEARRRLILGHRTDRGTGLRAVHDEVQGQEHQQRPADDHERLDRDVDVLGDVEAKVESVHRRIDEIEGVSPERLDEADEVLQEEGDPDRGDQRNQPRRPAQRTVGDPLHRDGEQPAGGHAGDEDQQEHERPGKTVEEPDALQAEKDLDADEGAEDEDLGVREVDELEDAVDHRVAERDEGVHETESDAVEKYLRKDPDQKLDVHVLGRKRPRGPGGRRLRETWKHHRFGGGVAHPAPSDRL